MITKDLRIFKGIDLKRCVIVDNSPANFVNQWDNGIPIIPFYGKNPDDKELVKLGHYLKLLASADRGNVRKANGDYFRLRNMKDCENEVKALNVLLKP